MSDQPASPTPASPEETQPALDPRAQVQAAKTNLKQAKEAVKAAKKVASQARKEVKALKKSLPRKKSKGSKNA